MGGNPTTSMSIRRDRFPDRAKLWLAWCQNARGGHDVVPLFSSFTLASPGLNRVFASSARDRPITAPPLLLLPYCWYDHRCLWQSSQGLFHFFFRYPSQPIFLLAPDIVSPLFFTAFFPISTVSFTCHFPRRSYRSISRHHYFSSDSQRRGLSFLSRPVRPADDILHS